MIIRLRTTRRSSYPSRVSDRESTHPWRERPGRAYPPHCVSYQHQAKSARRCQHERYFCILRQHQTHVGVLAEPMIQTFEQRAGFLEGVKDGAISTSRAPKLIMTAQTHAKVVRADISTPQTSLYYTHKDNRMISSRSKPSPRASPFISDIVRDLNQTYALPSNPP